MNPVLNIEITESNLRTLLKKAKEGPTTIIVLEASVPIVKQVSDNNMNEHSEAWMCACHFACTGWTPNEQ